MSAFDDWYTEEMEAEIFTQGVEESLENAFNAGLEAAAVEAGKGFWQIKGCSVAEAIRALKGE